jgi:hypothetical protein
MMTTKKPGLALRAPKDPNAFVAGRAAAEPTERAAAAPRPKGRGLVTRAGGGQKDHIHVYLDPVIGQRLREHCFDNRLDISAVVADVVERFVRTLPARRP